MFFICIGVGVFGLYKIHSENSEVERAEELAAEYAPFSPSKYFESGNEFEDIYNRFMPQLEELQGINGDVVGWIYIPSTNIDYPLLCGSDNDWYLKHTPKGEYSAAGSVFVDAKGFDTNNTIIYAHNMGRRSDIMFHDITNFSDENWFEKVKYGYIITNDGVIRLGIFAYTLTKPQSEFYYDDVSFDFIKGNAMNYRTPEEDGRMVTLSTCAYDYKDARGVLSCIGKFVFEK